LFWWFGSIGFEVETRVPYQREVAAQLMAFAGSALLVGLVARRVGNGAR
jgi:hypothetical protein